MNTSPPRLPYHRSLATLVTLAFLSAFPAFGAEAKVGEAFPSLAEAQLEGNLPELKGKVVLVDFWASWCGPCRAAFPALKEIAGKYKDQVVIVGVSLDEDKEDMDGFVRKMTPNFPIVRDPKGKLAEKLDVQSIPSTFILDAQGRIAAIHSGYGGDTTKKEFIETIDKLIAAR